MDLVCQKCGVAFVRKRYRGFCGRSCAAKARPLVSQETRTKLSSSLAGRKLTEEHKKKIGEGNKGILKPHSEERKRQISLQWSGSGNPKWEPDREKLHLRQLLKGKCHWILKRSLRDLKQKKIGTTAQMLGYTPDQLREYIEHLWQPEMTWENYGYRGWHIDHIRPISRWPLDAKPSEVNALSNLQPLWWLDNLRKGSEWNDEATAVEKSLV